MPGKCSFNFLWLTHEEYKFWIRATADKTKAKCNLCCKEFDIATMGEAAVKSHMKGKKHVSLFEASCKSNDVKQFFTSAKSNQPKIKENTSLPTPSFNNHSLTSFMTGNESIDAEIKWTVKCVLNNYSVNSCEDISTFFVDMFPDSEIAKKFSCCPTKCTYIMCFGIAPFFSSTLIRKLNELENFTLIFDESFNRCTQLKQMDLHVRFWDKEDNIVQTRYYNSAFLGHSTAEKTLLALTSTMEKLDLSKLLHLSMDGPAVNWKVFNTLQDHIKNVSGVSLINTGSCGLHIINNSFKDAYESSSWNIEGFLTSLYYLFQDSPARREDYFQSSSSSSMPVKFCKHRWLENDTASERALQMWDDIKKYVADVEKKKYMKPKCKSFAVISDTVKDALMPAKLNFFISVVKIVQPFLGFYQSDWPLFPFMADDLKKLVVNTLKTFNVLKQEYFVELKTPYKISIFDFTDKAAYSSISKVSCGFVSDRLLKELLYQKRVSDMQVMDFKHECQSFIFTMVKNLALKSPLKYGFVRHLACLDPKNMYVDNNGCYVKMKHILGTLTTCKRIAAENCDEILLQYQDFLSNVASDCPDFKDFDAKETRLDQFLGQHMNKKEKYKKVWKVITMVLTLSHGQASVERGFSVNRQIEVENMKEETYVSKRLIKDEIKHCGGLKKFKITKELRISVVGARQKYMFHLEQQRKMKEAVTESKKRKCFFEELEQLKHRKTVLSDSISELQKAADKLAEKAEQKSDIKFITQSNSLRKTAKEKIKELGVIEAEINTYLVELKK